MKLCKKIIVLLVIVILAGTVLPATPSQSVVYDYRQSKSLYHVIDTCSQTDLQIYTDISWTTIWDLGLKPCSICNPQPPSDLNLSTNFTTQPTDKYFHKADCTVLNNTSLKITMDLKTLLNTGRVPCPTCKPEMPLIPPAVITPIDPNSLIGPQGPQGPQGIQGPQGEQGLIGPMGIEGKSGRDSETPCTIWNYATGERWKSPLWFTNRNGRMEWNIGYNNDGLWYANIPAGTSGQWVFSDGAWVEATTVNRVVAIFYGNTLAELEQIIIDKAITDGKVERIGE